jgi:hypothetical protein
MHRSRVCHFVIDVSDLDQGVTFWSAAPGAKRWDHQQERGFGFWVMRDPWENGFCILQT